MFIARGGVIPFVVIFKDLERKGKVEKNKLLFADKMKSNVILNDNISALLSRDFVNVLYKEKVGGI